MLALADVPDPVFSAGMVGDGLAVSPAENAGRITVTSPIAGELVKVHPHAFVVVAESGVGVLVHVGLDTVGLKGRGFEVREDEGAVVEAGQPVLDVDVEAVVAAGLSPICPVVVLDTKPGDLGDLAVGGEVAAQGPLFQIPDPA
ncbi:PTS glucose transporter subunit IIA [Falsarthrobacter nasiphocae]